MKKTLSILIASILISSSCLNFEIDESPEIIEPPATEETSGFCPDQGEQTITFWQTKDSITIPRCWEHVPLQGIDTEVGEINYEEAGIKIQYDIGGLAGNYANRLAGDTIDIQEGKSINESFIYVGAEGDWYDSDDCCIFITFPNAGPANFITLNDENLDAILDVMRSFMSN